MDSGRIILISVIVISILCLIFITPRDKIREAHLVFLFKQFVTWLLGIIVVEFHLIEYPVRIIQFAAKTSFVFEFIAYPTVCTIFVLRFPEHKSLWHKAGWYVLFPTWMTILEVWMEHSTDLIRYIHWTWYFTWLTLLITFHISRVYYKWFIQGFRDRKKA